MTLRHPQAAPVRPRRKLVSVAVLVLLLPSLASAQPLESTEYEVIVSATRGRAQDPLSVPQSTEQISRADLEETAYVDVDDAIRRLPGIALAPAEGTPNFWQEGFSIRGLGGQRVLTLTDSIRQAGQGIGYGGGNLSLYDLWGIERIEIIKGSSSVLYGTDAFGGVINVITREPIRREELGMNGGLRYLYDGSQNLNRGGLYFDVGDETFGMVLGASYTDAGQPNLPDDQNANQGSFEEISFFSKLDYYLSDDTKLRLIANSNRSNEVLVAEEVIPFPIAVFPPGESELIFSPLDFRFPEYGRALVGLELESNDVSDSIDYLNTRVFWQRLYREFARTSPFYPTGSPGFAGPPLFFDPAATVSISSVETDDTVDTIEVQTQVGIGNTLMGVDLGYDIADQQETETQIALGQAGVGAIMPRVTPLGARERVDAEQLRFGVFAKHDLEFGALTVTPGARFDLYAVDDSTSGFSDEEVGFSGSLGNLYRVTEEQAAFLNLGTGFRAPDLGERFQNGIVNFGVPSRVLGQPELDPERSWNSELGYKYRGDDWTVQTATYVNYIDDYIGQVELGTVDGFDTDTYDNVGGVVLYGYELAVDGQITEGWDVYGTAARTFSEDRDKVDVTDWAFNYGTTYTYAANTGVFESARGGLHFRTVLESNEFTEAGSRDDSLYQPGTFTVVDLRGELALYETGSGVQATLVGGIQNLFDKEYQEPFFGVNQPKRSLYGGVQLEF